MNKSVLLPLTLLLALGGASLPAYAQSSAPASGLSVKLPNNPKLNKTLTINVPSGAPLATVLGLIAKTSGLTLLSRDIPNVPVSLNLSGLTTKQALEQLLNLYSDQVKAQLSGDTLIVAPADVIERLTPKDAALRAVLPGAISETTAKNVTQLTGAAVIPLGGSTIISGTAAQVSDARNLLELDQQAASTAKQKAPTLSATFDLGMVDAQLAAATLSNMFPGIQVETAYGRLYLLSPSQADLDGAVRTLTAMKNDAAKTLPPPVPTTATSATPTRILSSSLPFDTLQKLAAAVAPGVKLTPVDRGSYVVSGSNDEYQTFLSHVKAAETREAIKITVGYPGAASLAQTITTALPQVDVQVLAPDLLVRGTPNDLLRVSALVSQILPTARTQPSVTMQLKLAYTTPKTVAEQLAKLYAKGNPPAQASAAGPALTAPNAGTESSLINGVSVATDERTRSVVLFGPADVVSQMARTVSDLDTKIRDVRLALKVEQVDGSNGQDLGLDWRVAAGGFSLGVSSGAVTAAFQPGLSPLSVQGTLNLARSQGRVHTLLDTTFVAQDGRSVNFKNGGQILINNQSSSTTGGTTTTTTTQSSYNFGLEVVLTPRLAPDGTVELDVKLQLGQAPKAGVGNSIQIDSQSMATTTTLTPGEGLILGSVVSLSDSNSSKGLPVLSEIPVIGGLFGKTSASKTNSLLLITIQAGDRAAKDAPVTPSTVTKTTTPGH